MYGHDLSPLKIELATVVAHCETLKDILSHMIHETTRMSPLSTNSDYLCRIDRSLFEDAQRAIR